MTKKIMVLVFVLICLGLVAVFTTAFAGNYRGAVIPQSTDDTGSIQEANLIPPEIPSPTLASVSEITSPTSTAVPGITVQAIQKYAHSQIQTQSNLNIEVSVANFRKEGKDVLVDACYQLPNDLEWTVDKASITTAKLLTLPLSAGSGLEFTKTLDDSTKQKTTFGQNGRITVAEYKETGDSPNYRCDTLSFGPTPDSEDLSSFKLTIHSLIAIPREGQECLTFLNQVQPILDAKGSGIKIDCSQEEGGARVSIIRKPDSLTREEAEAVIAASAVPNVVQGEWMLEGGIK